MDQNFRTTSKREVLLYYHNATKQDKLKKSSNSNSRNSGNKSMAFDKKTGSSGSENDYRDLRG
jgi:hypothetical protein